MNEKDVKVPLNLRMLISSREISDAVSRLAATLDVDYRDRNPVMVGVLKGSFIFMADLVRHMETDVRSIEFIRYSSYGSNHESSGNATLEMGVPRAAIEGRDVVLVEDIVDTGITTAAALGYLRGLGAASVKLCAMLDKSEGRRASINVDYVGLEIPNVYVVGYGLDSDQRYRQLPGVYAVE